LVANLPGAAYRCELTAPFAILLMSEGAQNLTGYSAAEWLTQTRSWMEIVHPDDAATITAEVEAAVAERRGFTLTYRIFHAGGDVRWVLERGQAIFDGDTPLYLEGFLGDITQQKLLEETLRSAEAESKRTSRKLSTALESTSDCIFSLDRALRFTYLNNKARDYIRNGGELLGRSALEVFAGGGDTIFAEVFARVLRSGGAEDVEAYFPPSGRWYEARVTPSEDGITVFFRDITRRRWAEEELRQSKAQATQILDNVPQIIWSADREGRCEYLSSQYYGFTGSEQGADFGKCWTEAIHPDDVAATAEQWQEAVRTGSELSTEFRLRHRTGAYRWTLVQAAPHRSDKGEILRWYGTCTDVHDAVLAQRALEETSSLNSSILGSSPDCIKLMELDGTILFVNPLGPRTLDLDDPTPLLGACWFDLLEPEVRAQAQAAVKAAAQGRVEQFTAMQPTITGREKWFHIAVSPVVSGEAIERVVVIARDITEQKAAEAALAASELMHRSVLEASADCIKIIALDGTLELMNTPGVCALELDSAEEVQGQEWAGLWPEDAQATVRAAMARALQGETARFTEYRATAKGTPKWWDVVITPMRGADGEVSRLLSISRDITANRETAEQLRWASERDSLTGLANRRTFQAHLQAATLRAMEKGAMVGLLLLDLDHFKHVNDTLGHAAGDHLLQTFAQRLEATIRANDFVARLGGDEFAVVMEDIKDGADLMRAGASLLARLHAPIRFDGRVLSASASIGGALFPADAASAHELFNNADTALYALKAAGRGGTKMFHHHMREQAQKVASQLSLARVALSEQSVIPHYQPKIDLQTGAVIGYEALLRWLHPRHGMQAPDTVAEAFKDYELASKIGELMQYKVMKDIRAWQRAGIEVPRVSINAAPAEFLRDDYAERLLRVVGKAGISPSLIEIEVTEHVFLDRGSEFVERALKMLNQAGVYISLDDFGTGYSSLSHLRDFPVDVVKIDQSFISKMVDEPEIAAIVSAVIDLARSLSIHVVAEGIETEGQKAMLKEKGCSFGQGYLFGRAAPADEVQAMLQKLARLAA
jgi:diguanylate cyclase (GGDEF)-like protein/PAS domain S-box-containing protein